MKIACVQTVRVLSRRIAALSLLAAFSTNSHAQWTVTNLQPASPTATESTGQGSFCTQQAGRVLVTTATTPTAHAAIWSGTAASWMDLNPPTLLFSQLNATSGTQQAGVVVANNQNHASM